ncbi:MAG: site-specific integrase [Desulfoplanes sp.]
MTYKEINQMIRQMIGRMLIDYEDECMTVPLNSEDELDNIKDRYEDLLNDTGMDLLHREHWWRRERVNQFLKERGINPTQEDLKKINREYLKGLFKACQLIIQRNAGKDFNAGDKYIFEAEKNYSVYRISDLVRDHMQEQKPKITEKTFQENEAIYAQFIHVCGDLNIKLVNRKCLIEYRDTLAKLPPNINKTKKYKDKNIKQILALNPTPISTNTLNKRMTRLSSLFKWAKQSELMTTNPAEELTISSTRKAYQERSPFSPEDLHKIFNSEGYSKDNFKHSYMFWIPLLALYTGCRANELCQLHLDDIKQDTQGIWVLDINSKEEKKLKNATAERLIPIHETLLKLNFLDHVDTLRAMGETRLFHELKRGRDGYLKNVTRWFGKYKEECGVEAKKGDKTLHSFRHTFADTFKQMDANMKHVSQILGHSIGDDQTNNRYSNPYKPEILKTKVMDRLEFKEVNVELLKHSKWI